MQQLYRFTLSGALRFEAKSLFGRIFLAKNPPLKEGKNYLNLGCGSNFVEGESCGEICENELGFTGGGAAGF